MLSKHTVHTIVRTIDNVVAEDIYWYIQELDCKREVLPYWINMWAHLNTFYEATNYEFQPWID